MYDSPAMTPRQIKAAAKAIFKLHQKGKTMSNAQSVTTRINESPAAEAMRTAAEAAAAKAAEKAAKKAEKLAALEKSRAELKEIKARVKAEKAAKKAAEQAAKPPKAPKVAGEPKVRKPSASALFCSLIMEGKLTDAQIFAEVQKVFGLDDGKKGYTKWYRNDLRKKGKNPPGPVAEPVAEAPASAE